VTLCVTPQAATWLRDTLAAFGAGHVAPGFVVELRRCGERSAPREVRAGAADAALVTAAPDAAAAPLRCERLGDFALALVAHAGNRVASIPAPALRGVVLGETSDWRSLGGGSGDIELFATAWEPAADPIPLLLARGDRLSARARRCATDLEVAAAVARRPHALGICSLAVAAAAQGVRVLAVDLVPPSPAALQRRAYAPAGPVFLLSRGGRDPRGEVVQAWLALPATQAALRRSLVLAR
jgi:hypothetical protein